MFKTIKPLFQSIYVIVIIALLIIHFILKDSTFLFSLFFYAFPLPIIIGIILTLSVFINKKSRKYNLKLALLLILVWFSRSFKIHSAENIEKTDLEVVFWNASHDRNFEDAFKVNSGIPDVFVLVETNYNEIETLQLRYPNYYFYLLQTEIGIFSKTPIDILKEESSIKNSTIIEFKTKDINFYIVDVAGSVDVNREGEFEFVKSFFKENKNTIILGDFNAPYESIHFKSIKNDFNHSFTEKGNGFRETWFWNLPLLSLDHIWASKDLEILKTEKISTFKSDHSMIKTFIRK